jgi:hypothetical protein
VSATGGETDAKRTGTTQSGCVGKIGNVVSLILRLKFQSIETRQATREGRCWGSRYENAEKANDDL